MNREDQRQLGAMAVNVARLLRDERATYPATVFADADLMEHLSLEGGEIFKDYTAEQRRRMAKSGQAMPDGSFPIATCDDAANAIHAIGRAKNPDATKSFIRRRVRALNCSGAIYDAWK